MEEKDKEAARKLDLELREKDLALKERKLRQEEREKEAEINANNERLKMELYEREQKLIREKESQAIQAQLDQDRLGIERERLAQPRAELHQNQFHTLDHVKADVPELKSTDRLTIEEYIINFKRVMSVYEIEPRRWMRYLLGKLPLEIRSLINTMSEEDAKDFDKFETVLQQKYLLTPDFFRTQFRTLTQGVGETMKMYVTRMLEILTKWLKASNVDQDYESLLHFMVKDQIYYKMQTQNKEKLYFLRERDPSDLDELCKHADVYDKAHMTGGKQDQTAGHSHKTQNSNQHNHKKSSNNSNGQSEKQTVAQDKTSTGLNTVEKHAKKYCAWCKTSTHHTIDCYRKPDNFKADNRNQNGSSSQRVTNEPQKPSNFSSSHHHGAHHNNNQHHGTNHRTAAMQIVGAENLQQLATHCEGCSIQEHENREVGLQGDVEQMTCGCCIYIPRQPQKDSAKGRLNPTARAFVGGKLVTCMRDTGASICTVHPDHVRPEQYTNRKVHMRMLNGTYDQARCAVITVDTPFYTGQVECAVLKDQGFDLVMGNAAGVKPEKFDIDGWIPKNPDHQIETPDTPSKEEETEIVSPQPEIIPEQKHETQDEEEFIQKMEIPERDELIAAVETRQQRKLANRRLQKLGVPNLGELNIEKDDFIKMQREDESLKACFAKVGKEAEVKNNFSSQFFIKNKILKRKLVIHKKSGELEYNQLVVPAQLRNKVLMMAHDSILSAHMGQSKTFAKIEMDFYWPSYRADTTRWVMSCEVCQRTAPASSFQKVPLQSIKLETYPFQHVFVDLVGEIIPKSDRGYRYILTQIDNCTRYPSAICLKKIDSESVADGLFSMWSHLGIPEKLTTDNGSQFVGEKMRDALKVLQVRGIHCSPWHPQSNISERLNKSLKTMLKRLCHEKPQDWDRYLDACLFAYRDCPQSGTGYSPFELLGRTVRGPLTILKQLWTKEQMEPETKSQYQYVLELKEKIRDTCELARSELAHSQAQNKKYFDKRAKHRSLKEGELVLVLLPTESSKLTLKWKGPYKIVGKVGLYDYKVQVDDHHVKVYHINMLKLFNQREVKNLPEEAKIPSEQDENLYQDVHALLADTAAVASVFDEDPDDPTGMSLEDREMIVHYNTIQKESYLDVKINPNLPKTQIKILEDLVKEFSDLFTDVPKATDLERHVIHLRENEICQSKPYPVPINALPNLDKELDELLRLGIIVPSSSYFTSPLVLVKKPDGSTRVCVNYKKLNAISFMQPEPMNNISEIFDKLGGKKIYSKFDLCKGYYQIEMAPESVDLTTFTSHRGNFAFKRMPFGLSSAPATFTRMMRKLLANAENLDSYLDDVLAHTRTFEEHIKTLRNFFTRVREANLAIKPSKCQLGYTGLDFLGHKVHEDTRTPSEELLNKIFEAARPVDKTKVRSFLGLTGFYQNYIANYSDIAAPLTDLTKKSQPTKVNWSTREEQAFQTLKTKLLSKPILKMPCVDKEFILRCDASGYGVGAVILQEHDGTLHPVSYASRKLSEREVKWPISSKEALSIVFGCLKFHKYLYGRHFTIETDHKPLTILKGPDSTNPRLMKYAIALQPYDFTTKVIPGVENIGADFFSRHLNVENSSVTEQADNG